MRKQQCWLAFCMHFSLCVVGLQSKLLNMESQLQLNSSHQTTASAGSLLLQASALPAAGSSSSKQVALLF
jgi:hypothetical protein